MKIETDSQINCDFCGAIIWSTSAKIVAVTINSGIEKRSKMFFVCDNACAAFTGGEIRRAVEAVIYAKQIGSKDNYKIWR